MTGGMMTPEQIDYAHAWIENEGENANPQDMAGMIEALIEHIHELQNIHPSVASGSATSVVGAPRLWQRIRRQLQTYPTEYLRILSCGRLLYFDFDCRSRATFVFEVLAEIPSMTNAPEEACDIMENWSPPQRA
jgi:hypothetical protein